MSDHRNPNPSPDVSLLLRAHAEQRWLSGEVIPVVRQIETRERLPEEQLSAALAYLEVTWAEALARARETESERARQDERGPVAQALAAKALRYHAAVRTLREAAARRVAPLLAAPAETLAQWPGSLQQPGSLQDLLR